MHLLAAIGGVVALVSHAFWIWGIVSNRMHLNLATWLLWALIDITILLSSIAAGASAPFLAVGFAGGAVAVALTLLFKGTWQWGRLESVCAILAIVCLILWFVGGPLIALVSLTLGKYIIAGIPTLRSAYKNPEWIQAYVWWLGSFGAATNIFAAGSWTLEQSFFPTVALLFTAIAGLINFRRLIA